MISFTCPNCGAIMELDDQRDTLFCAYCGQKLFIDSRTRKVKIEKQININQNIKQHIIDEAAVEEEKTRRSALIGIYVVMAIFYLGFFVALALRG